MGKSPARPWAESLYEKDSTWSALQVKRSDESGSASQIKDAERADSSARRRMSMSRSRNDSTAFCAENETDGAETAAAGVSLWQAFSRCGG